MHICFLSSEYPKPGFAHGGVGTFLQILARNLVKHNIRVSIVGLNYTEDYEEAVDQGVFIYRLKPRKFKPITWYLSFDSINSKIKEIHQKNPISIVESTELGLAFIRKIPGIKYLIRMNGGHHFFSESENRCIDPWKGFQEKRSFKKADLVFGVSEYVINHTLKYLDFADKKGPVIYNPANLENFHEADPSKIIPGRIFFAGTVCEKKGVRQLILAFPKIKKLYPESELFIAGRDWHFPDGSSYIDYLKKSQIDKEVKESIKFLGPVPNHELPNYMEEAEICAYPSHMEAMPLAWIEVLSMGKAFLGSSLGPGPEVVNDNVTGRVCDPRSVESVENVLLEMLSNKDHNLQMAKAAREDVLQRFAIDKLVLDNIELFKTVVAE
ncbi:Glycosyltransferase involved in cell wall bisynthesis [Algoriphagus locisalis]|uniref:Glycosyltransferase involved in cell wall bisynthesis n=1 Tax=Algoriphagus locisalis TaxID=305507 RepID=A0A1I6XPR1_9BACT|nr:glycosyltransferase family 4 protein [Algoriphagus locisalis]SFT40300.1 Glycosyltransferase involved in cell wall bisynthesis [Algoriphagus locisalis]